jgi:glycosyltransferase involved in cell wall biosynthesis
MTAKNVKIAHLSSAHPPGDIRIFHKECVSLAKHWNVYLVVTNCENEISKGVEYVTIQKKGKGRLMRMIHTTKAVYHKALELDADIYHIHDPELLPYALKLVRRGKKVIYDVHEDVPKQIMDKHWIPKLFRGLVSSLFKRYEHYVAARLSGIISVTPIICERFRSVNKHVELVANYPLLEEGLNLNHQEGIKVPRQICYIGGLFPTRGIKELVQALEQVDATLVLAGTFSPASFEEEVKQLPGWKKVNFLGHVGRQEIMRVLTTSELGVVTLHPTQSYVEALPIKLFEYMSAGIPVLASDFPMWREIIDSAKCGVYADPLNPKDIAKQIDYLLSNPELSKEMGENGLKAFHETYNWSAEEQKLIAFYQRISEQQ